MNFLEGDAVGPYLGLAYGPGFLEFIDANPGVVDYVEVPFEQLRHSPDVASIQEIVPVVLHCASMSIAGFIPPSEATLEAIARETDRTRTPWIGEHLAFVSADGISEAADRDATPTNLTYTLCPQLSGETIERVAENLAVLRPRFGAPIILENSPQYFAIPGSTMNMVDFVAEVVTRCDVGLLLDLSHFAITSLNTGVDALEEIERLPLERVVEIHVSGYAEQSGVVWDDHAAPAPPLVFDLLEHVMARSRPRALTMEYNWQAFPQSILLPHIDRTRELLAQT
jgi:uncharacterized protein (UPF0276 family)